MPPAIYTQSVIAVIWDFDKTLTHDYMQGPLFTKYGVDSRAFWEEVNNLSAFYSEEGDYRIANDTIYLNHILTYIREGIFKGLTAKTLRELGNEIQLAPGLPGFFDRLRQSVDVEPYRKHDVRVEHYVVSTGLRAMIKGSRLASHVEGIWACDLLPPAPPVHHPGNQSQDVIPGSDGDSEVLSGSSQMRV